MSMIRHSILFGVVAAGILVARVGPLNGAGSAISGTVKVTGLATSADVVVYVQEAPGTFPLGKPVVMDQLKMQFIPHVLPVVAGTAVKFSNSDPTPHNVFSPDNEKYNLGTWPKGQSKDYTFSKCAKTPCVYTQLCKVHPEMEGFVVVLQNPYFAVTDKDGHYEIAGVPPGNYTLAVWHARTKAQPKPVTVEAAKPATVDFSLAR
jgi:plastocyanin